MRYSSGKKLALILGRKLKHDEPLVESNLKDSGLISVFLRLKFCPYCDQLPLSVVCSL